jgi:hypothetical protein
MLWQVWRALSSTILRRALLEDYERKYAFFFAKHLTSLHASMLTYAGVC